MGLVPAEGKVSETKDCSEELTQNAAQSEQKMKNIKELMKQDCGKNDKSNTPLVGIPEERPNTMRERQYSKGE